ncbi:MAG: hypothetical protein ACLFQO_05045 [Cyclobacteriaceae bacterium]
MIYFRAVVILIVYTLLHSAGPARAQTKPDELCREIQLSTDSVFLDSLSLVPSSLRVSKNGQFLEEDAYSYDYNSGYLHLSVPIDPKDRWEVCYRRLPFSLAAGYQHKSLELYDSTSLFSIKETSLTGLGVREELFSTPRLQKSGSLSRGLSVGNRQDVFVNSALNLQMQGELSEDLSIRAAITDQNIPVQPDGNTQQLQDFDNVYIELFNDHFSLTAGDVILQQSAQVLSGNARAGNQLNIPAEGPYFLRYRRNVQGALLKTKRNYGKRGSSSFSGGFALAEGKFSSVQLSVQEGVLGPYQLKSPQNQLLSGNSLQDAFYIIANSEKVYLDGQLLERGFDNDYVIDYNLSEITFTSRVLITRFSRLVVDFEYADRSYSRSIMTAAARHDFEKLSVYAHYYREKDNPRQTLGFSLSDDDKWQLSEAGDSPEQAYVSTVRLAEQEAAKPRLQTNRRADVPGVGNLYQVFYDQKDTVVNGESYEVYVFAGQKGAYQLDFNYVGEGKGDYVLSSSAVNTRVYAWVAPLEGMKRGNYAPVRPLQAPVSHQLFTLGAENRLSKHDKLRAEVAVSENDLNLFSELDARDDQGQAVLLIYENNKRKLGKSAYHWGSSLGYEYRSRHFREADPYRTIEFERDWTVLPAQLADTIRYDDQILTAAAQLEKNYLNRFSYQWSGRRYGKQMAGMQHRAELSKKVGPFQVGGDLFLLRSSRQENTSTWNRLSLDAHLPGSRLVPGYTFRMDKNQVQKKDTDSVTLSLMNFEEHLFYLRNSDSLDHRFRLDYSRRRDFAPYLGQMLSSDLAHTFTASADLDISKSHQFSLQTAYRKLTFQNDQLLDHKSALGEGADAINSLMGQLNWSGRMLHGAMHSDLHYSLANGREPRREFVYVQVPVGEGAYTWRDDNQNGVEELDEFYEARYFDERNYIRVFVPTTDFVLAYTNSLHWQLRLQAPANWKEATRWQQWLTRLSAISSWQVTKRVSNEELATRLLPLADSDEEGLLSVNEKLRSNLFFNRNQTHYGAELGLRRSRRRQLLSAGFEERNMRAAQLSLRWNLSRHWGVNAQAEQGHEAQQLEVGNGQGRNRDFNINYHRWQPELAWQPDMNTRLSLTYTRLDKKNLPALLSENLTEISSQHIIGLEVRLSKITSHNLNASLEMVEISYSGQENSPLAYEMLDGLRSGSNARWTLNWQQHLLEGLQLLLNYQGRKSADSRAVHAGSLMIRAMF